MVLNISVNRIFYFLLSVVFAFIAFYLSSSFSHDAEQYKINFEQVLLSYNIGIEYSFVLVSHFSDFVFSSYYFLFLFYSFVAVYIKVYLIEKHSLVPFLSIIVYMSYFFLTQEGNMIRSGLAVSFFFLASFSFFEKKYFSYLFFSFLAFFFHYSCFVSFLLPFLFTRSIIFGYLRAITLVLFCFLFAGLSYFYDWLTALIIAFQAYDPTGKLQDYINLQQSGIFDKVNFINRFLPYFLFLIPFFVFYFNISKKDVYFSYYFQIVVFGLFVFSFLSPIPALAYRFSEIFLVFSIFLFPYICFVFKSRLIGFSFVVFYFLVNFYYIVIYSDYYGFL